MSSFEPCPFCGEPEMLVGDGSMSRLVFTDAGEIALDGAGDAIEEDVEVVSCLMCDAMAPVDIWNRRAEPHPHRAVMATYYREDPAFPGLAPLMAGAA